jgi:hypothetical protein
MTARVCQRCASHNLAIRDNGSCSVSLGGELAQHCACRQQSIAVSVTTDLDQSILAVMLVKPTTVIFGRVIPLRPACDHLRQRGGVMGENDVPIIRPKRSWGKEQWDHYNRMPWVARRLADLMVLFPGLSGWILRPAWTVEEKSLKRIDHDGQRDMTNERQWGSKRTGTD